MLQIMYKIYTSHAIFTFKNTLYKYGNQLRDYFIKSIKRTNTCEQMLQKL